MSPVLGGGEGVRGDFRFLSQGATGENSNSKFSQPFTHLSTSHPYVYSGPSADGSRGWTVLSIFLNIDVIEIFVDIST